MNICLDITQNLKNQFVNHFKLKEHNSEYFLDSSIGGGQGMEFVEFPGRMEFYHFKKSYFRIPVNMKSINPTDTQWFLLHINLSKIKQQKKVADKTIDFHKHLPIGILLYGPGLEIDTLLPQNVEIELATIHFHFSFLDTYFENWREVIDVSKNLAYEDLDYKLEQSINKVLSSIRNKIDCHAKILNFIKLYFDKLSNHSKSNNYENLHSEDVKNLFITSIHLRNPLATSCPSLEELASISNMGLTKFKTSFKQLFGSPPLQYRNKIRMEYAKEELIAKRKSPTELSYDLGYSHPSNFTAAYKKYHDVLPSSQE